MDFNYFKSLIEFSGACVSEAYQHGSCQGHSVDYWHGAYITAAIVAKDLFPKETESYFSQVVMDLRIMGEDMAADDFQEWLEGNMKRRH